jgi:hypothetical protein
LYIQAPVHIWRPIAGLISADWAYHESQTESKGIPSRTLEAHFLIADFQLYKSCVINEFEL